MYSYLIVALCLLAAPFTGAAETVGFIRKDHYPGFESFPAVDSYPTEFAIYVVGGRHLYSFHADVNLRSRPHVLDLSPFRPDRIYPLGTDHLLIRGIQGTRLIDISTPLTPTIQPVPNEAEHVAAVAGTTVYMRAALPDLTPTIRIYNFETPSEPQLLGQIEDA